MNTKKSLFDHLADEINASTEIPEVIKKKLLTNIMKSKAEPVNLLITGPTGCGKSSTINAMLIKKPDSCMTMRVLLRLRLVPTMAL